MIAKIKENCHEIPVLGHAEGICHVYVDSEADVDTAIKIIIGNVSFISSEQTPVMAPSQSAAFGISIGPPV